MPIFSVTKTKLKDAEIFDVKENQGDALYSQSPSYMGEAEINSTTFEPKGIEVPTKIYSSAEEAIDLTHFPAEICKYIRKISF